MAEECTLRSFLQLEDVRDRYITDLNTEKRRFSYAQVLEEVENLRSFLKGINVKPGEEISIILFNSIEYVVSFLGINYNKNICLPLNTNLKKEEYVRYLVNNCKYIIIHDYDENDDIYFSMKKKHGYYKNVCKSIEELGIEHNIGVIRIRKNKEAPFFTYSLSRPCGGSNAGNMKGKLSKDNGLTEKGSDVCLHLHTSGTTSKVKIVQLTNENIKTTIKNITNSYGLSREDNTVIVMPLYHVHGLIGVLMPILYAKGNVLFQVGHSFSASEFWKDVVHHNITYFSAVPTILKILLLRYESDYFVDGVKVKHKLRFIRTSSSQLDEHMEREAEVKFETNVLQAYGMTEACHQVSTNKLILTHGKDVSIVKKYKSVGIPNVGVIIYDHEKKRVCRKNELGEICINGKNVMCGYKEMKDNENICVHINTVKERAEYMEGNTFLITGESVPFFKTGDVGYVDEDNFLFIAGRIKDIINRGGEKIIPNEIDDVVRDDPRVSDCLSFACTDEVYGEAIYAAVILDEKQLPWGEALQKAQAGSFTSGVNPINDSLPPRFVTSITSTGYGASAPPQHSNPPVENEFNVEVSLSLNFKYHYLRKELTEQMKKRLADFKVPQKIYFVNHFLKTDTGKVSRRKMAEGVEHLKGTPLNLFDVLALCLKKAHLDGYIYGLYGIPLNKMIHSFVRNKIYYISFRNEINACVSCSYVNYFDEHKEKKKVGIILTCSGPAFVNALPGLYNAKVNHFPLIFMCFENFTAKNLTEFDKHQNFQYFPQQKFLAKAKEMCAGVFHVNSPDAFPEQLYNCFETCLRMKSPVYLNVSYNLIGKEVTLDRALHLLDMTDCYAGRYLQPLNVLNGRINFSKEEDEKFNKLLQLFCRIYQSNKRGAIFLGTNCNHGVKYVLKLSHLMRIPIYTSTMAKCFVKENYLYNANQCKSFLFENLDFCFAFGTVYNFYFNFGNFPRCKKENMLCVDLTNDVFDPQVDSHCEHFFFSDLYRVVKQLYFSLKRGAHSIDVDGRMNWIAAIQEAKKRSIDRLCRQVATQHLVSEQFTMEQAMLILRHCLLDYFFIRNEIPAMYKRYFIDYFKYVDWAQLRRVLQGDVLPHEDDEADLGPPQSDCDLSDSSLEGGEQRDHTGGYDPPKKSKTWGNGKRKFLNRGIKKRVVITNEGSITLHLGILYLPQLGPYNFVIPQINGMMGVSMNAAICAALNHPENIVFAILGDSSFGFTSNEVETICRFKLKIVLIILNNNGIYGDRDFQTKEPYSEELNKDAHFFLQNPSALYHFSKYENYVTAHGGYGRYVDNREDFLKQIKHVMSENFSSFPVLLNVMVGDAQSVKFDVDKYIQ
ncbi:acyl-CoA synthetase, putative [Plasmodium knowlesi strain H]|uniref:Acyl-CoA synthetase, putative n=3 Tax=Plasmodium knowlesi TaxID=5850 RepID=A0A5K1V2E4_PLAKH|nr:acyl-CoA synthetase, putative [Plasmodium knowlesi strain H]OTN64580.1 putative Acyl-CoA synthetase [Plasmodium knowlesi]CAA9989133.1 acyl-CoA synthetase, putative [Plasmodium knowlesi strain H]SBO27350.1 acyl-CoA synthetase, putative [Plasmodium knowlesi strain H]SBO27535.1 acyl-CoA synthetase, putative [Plasmodium knowlesi strain H]VVS78607.1 acyl-CoA synthetase, putative [Plasmodium knowlesi strain H]|eukprot:XP_002261480.1 peroxisomal-coenzyme a synthase, putative [Plasmodium knowlesi strain H]